MQKIKHIVKALFLFVFFAFTVNLLLSDEKSLKVPESITVKKSVRQMLTRSIPMAYQAGAPEIEPNNGLEVAQQIAPPSPSTIDGSAEVSDAGDLIVAFEGGGIDDLEDIFEVTINSDSILITLTGIQSDLDLWLFDPDSLIRDNSLMVGVADEMIDNDTLQAGTYFIGVSIFDPDPAGPATSSYTMTVTGDIGTPTSVEERDGGEIPVSFHLGNNYPNPFNPTTRINYDLPETARVVLTIYNALGQEITTLVNAIVPRGAYVTSWDGRNADGIAVTSGLYFYTLHVGQFSQTKKMLYLR